MRKERYERPLLIEAGEFSTATAGFGNVLADQLVSRKI